MVSIKGGERIKKGLACDGIIIGDEDGEVR
jgi:hypothetical protein